MLTEKEKFDKLHSQLTSWKPKPPIIKEICVSPTMPKVESVEIMIPPSNVIKHKNTSWVKRKTQFIERG